MVPDFSSADYVPYSLHERIHPMPTKEQEVFFQTWLFFGLIHEALGGLYRQADFFFSRTEDCGGSPSTPYDSPALAKISESRANDWPRKETSFLTTQRLMPSLIEAWTARLKNKSEDNVQPFKHLRQCLLVATQAFVATHEDFDWRIKFSIASLCETMSHAVNRVLDNIGFSDGELANTSYAATFCGPEITAQMLHAGWCPSDISRAKDKFQSTQTLYFLSRMSRKEIERDHSNCTTHLCNSFQIDLKTYETRHRTPDCRCTLASPNADHVVAALQDGKLPVLKLTDADGDLEDLCIDVVEMTSDTPYVAISHVWAHGLGNPFACSIPRCQLSHVWKLAQNTLKSIPVLERVMLEESMGNNETLYIWLDTLCCPVSPPEAKSLALTQMRRTYEDARSVLVLDASLQCFESNEIDVTEALARIFTSGWMSRLWTLQEARLARSLWVQFKDKAIDLDSLLVQLRQASSADIKYLHFNFDMVAQHRTLRPSFYALQESHNRSVGVALYDLDAALHHRSTTVAADESLCIATLLDLPIHDLLKIPPTASSRMAKVWDLVASKYEGVPQQILAFDQPKLLETGKHWVPQTFLATGSQDMYSHSTRIERWTNPVLGTVVAEGLLTTYPGFILSLRNPSDGLPRNPWSFLPQIPEWHLLFMGPENQRYDVFAVSHVLSQAEEMSEQRRARKPFLHGMMHEGPCAIILLRESPETVPQRKWDGLFVGIDKIQDGVFYVKMKCHVLVTDMLPSTKLVYDTAEHLARQLRQEPATAEVVRLMPDQSKETSDSIETRDINPTSMEDIAMPSTATRSAEVDDEYYNAAVSTLKLRMQEVANEALKDPKLVDAIKLLFGDDDEIVGLFWRVVAEWFYHDFEGRRVGEDGKWCVD